MNEITISDGFFKEAVVMGRKHSFCLILGALGILVFSLVAFKPINQDDDLYFDIGNYTFSEYLPPNQNMVYSITIYEDEGLYANISIDGFHTLKRLNAKVWNHRNEIMLVFHDNYTDEDGNTTIPDIYTEGDILLKLKKQDGVIITEWEKLQPMIAKNQESGQYFIRVTE